MGKWRASAFGLGFLLGGLIAVAPGNAADYPAPGSTITLIVPWAPGGSVDIFGRLLAPGLEKELGVRVEVVNKPGAGAQIGMTGLAKAKPDGYTVALASLPGLATIYLDPARQAVFSGKDFAKVALTGVDPEFVVVPANSPHKTINDFAQAAKANPGKVRLAVGGLMGDSHLGGILLEKAMGVKLAIITFDGGLTPALTAMLGGHADAFIGVAPALAAVAKAGDVRIIGVMDRRPSKFVPDVKTVEAQGFPNVIMGASRGMVAPAGTPPEIVDKLAAAVRTAMESPELQRNLETSWSSPVYLGPKEYAEFFDKLEADTKELMRVVAAR